MPLPIIQRERLIQRVAAWNRNGTPREKARLVDDMGVNLAWYTKSGENDHTNAFRDMVEDAEGWGICTCYLPPWQINIRGDITMHRGTAITGVLGGGQSGGGLRRRSLGTVIQHYSDDNLFTWDGNGPTVAGGVGGGLRNVGIVKQNGYSGGTVIRLIATDVNHKPGEMIFDNIVAFGTGTGLWLRAVEVDGTASNDAGGRGIRTTKWSKVRFSDNSTPNGDTVLLNQATHLFGEFFLDTSEGAVPGIKLTGIWDRINLYGLRVGGDVYVERTTPPEGGKGNLVIEGDISRNLTISGDCAEGVFTGHMAGTLTNGSPGTFACWTNQGANIPALAVGGIASPLYELEVAGRITATYQASASAVTKINNIGGLGRTFVLPNGKTITFTASSGKLFTMTRAGNDDGLFHTSHASTVITILNDPADIYENSSTPASGKIGIFKSASSHIISVKNNTGSDQTIGIEVIGGICLSATDPA